MVDEPFSFNVPQNGAARGDTNNPESHLILRYIPEKPSGPPYLIENLDGKCFSLFSNNYKYELCPFNNITQREQGYRWNAFNGILGVWKEWLIDGDNFTSMHMVHGDLCAGNLERETKVNLTCGEDNAIVSVSEPSMCKYELIFKTPYACPKDVFFVYPMLSKDGKERWNEIENEHAINVTTEKGYKKYRKQLFIDEGLCVKEDLHKKIGLGFDSNDNPNPREQPATSSGIFAQDLHNINNQFATKQQCDVEYTRLLAEVEMLRQQLRNINLMNIQSAFIIGPPSTPDILEGRIKPITKSNISRDDNNGKGHAINLTERNKDDKYKKGDLGLYEKNITDIKTLHVRKLESSNEGSKSMLQKIASNNNTNTISKVKKKLKKRKKGDEGILDENSFPLRNLLGRLEYEANVISRLKVHGRLRDGQRKLVS